MKVYVLKRNDDKYKTETSEYLEEIWFAELFNDYEVAKCYCPSDCKVVGCELMETVELADHDKQIRKEVVQEIREKLKTKEIYHPEDEFEIDYDYYYKEDVDEILDQIEGGKDGKID